MSNTCAFPPEYNYTFQGQKYTLNFEVSAPLHIPENYQPPRAGETILWDYNGTPSLYQSHQAEGNFWEAGLYREPVTGRESVFMELAGFEMTSEQALETVSELSAWLTAACPDTGSQSLGGAK